MSKSLYVQKIFFYWSYWLGRKILPESIQSLSLRNLANVLVAYQLLHAQKDNLPIHNKGVMILTLEATMGTFLLSQQPSQENLLLWFHDLIMHRPSFLPH